MNTDVKIDDVVFRGVSLVTPSFESDVPKYKVDQGFSITDHIGLAPIKFEMDLTLYDGFEGDTEYKRSDQYDKIMEIWTGRKVFTFESDFGTFTNMVISKFTPQATSKSGNTFECTMTIEKIISATISLFETPVVREPDGTLVEIGSITGTGTEVALTVVDSIPEEELSWAEKLYQWAVEGW